MTNKTKFLKLGIAVLLGAGVVGSLLYAQQLSIPTNIDNAIITIRQVNVVDNANNAVITLSGGSSTPVQIQGSTSIGDTTTNTLVGQKSSIVGGMRNQVNGNYNIVGGDRNTITSSYSVIPGGANNTITANYGFIAGGQNNLVLGQYGFAGGFRAVSNAQGTFVWADNSSNSSFTGSTPNSFVIRANGGVAINTGVPTPGYGLTLQGSGVFYGNIKADNLVANAYYYGGVMSDDTLFNLDLSQRQEGASPDDIYYTSGDVGIGTNNPTAKLHTVGTVRLESLGTSSESTALVIASDGSIGTRVLNSSAFGGETDPVWTAEKSNYINTSNTAQTKLGNLTVARLISTQAAGTAPFQVTSNTVVANLNADLLDGQTSTYFLNTSATAQSKEGDLDIGGNVSIGSDLNVRGKLYVDSIVNRTITETQISVSGGLMPEATAPATYKRLGNSSNRWNELYVNNINAVLNNGTVADTTVVVKNSTNDLRTRLLNSVAFDGEIDPKVGLLTTGKRCVAANGRINCLADSPIVGETDPIFIASAAYGITSSNITTWNAKQNRVTSYCPAGSSIRVINVDGTVDCQNDNNTVISEAMVEGYIANDIPTGYIPYDNGTKLTGSNIYYNGTNVGIGTTSLAQKLEVAGSIRLGAATVNSNTTKLFLKNPAAGTEEWAISAGINMSTETSFGITNNWANVANNPWPFVISSAGNVGIGTNTPAPGAKLDVNGMIFFNGAGKGSSSILIKDPDAEDTWLGAGRRADGTKGAIRLYNRGCDGGCFLDNIYLMSANVIAHGSLSVVEAVTAQAFYYSSDITLKKDLTKITNPLDKILALNGYYFTWKSDDTKDLGVVAQEVEKVFPEAVKTDDKGLKSVKYGNLIAPIIESIKELYTKYLDQQDKISDLEQRIEILEKKIVK